MPKDSQLQHKVGDTVELEDGRKATVLGTAGNGAGLLLESGKKGEADYETTWYGVDKLKTKKARKSTAGTDNA